MKGDAGAGDVRPDRPTVRQPTDDLHMHQIDTRDHHG